MSKDSPDLKNEEVLSLADGNMDNDTTAQQAVFGGVGAGAGALIGTKIGVAVLGTAISGVWPLAVVGGIIGWLAAK